MNYRTVKSKAVSEFVEKRSRFIGHACPVTTEEEALAFIAEVKAKHRDARHNVYAYILRHNNTARYSDDGEPQGTAGYPSLEVLQKSGLTDVAVVVTRYFGGILLGGGGLLRAYTKAVSDAVAAAKPVTMKMRSVLTCIAPYALYDTLIKVISANGGAVLQSSFLENVTVEFSLDPDRIEEFDKALANATNGSIKAEYKGEQFICVED